MADASVRAMWSAYRDQADIEEVRSKNSQQVVLNLFRLYRTLTAEDRLEIDQFLAEQLGSADPALRFDSLAVIQEFRISSAIPALQNLAATLNERTPQIVHEKQKVERLIDALRAPVGP